MSSITLSLALRGRLLSGTQTTLQGALFGNNEPGFTFEPWDISTLYQDRAGTTPVTAAGQSVGLRLDKSQGLAIGPELVTNGTFGANITGWSNTGSSTSIWESGAARWSTATADFSGFRSASFATVVGRTYEFTATVLENTGAAWRIILVNGDGSYSNGTDNYTTPGTRTARFIATQTTSFVEIRNGTAATANRLIDNISVRELAGNHEVAVSDAKRGVYGWMPKTGRRNLLTYTEQFDNAAWSARWGGSATVSPNDPTFLAPDDTQTVDKVTATVGGSGAGQAIALTSGVTYTFSCWVNSPAAASDLRIATAATGGGVVALASIPSSASLVRYSLTYTPSVTQTYYVGVGNSLALQTVYIWGAQLELGSTATAYQRVVSQYDITEAGVPTCYYVQADGVDDAYVTPTITPNTDKAQVFAGVRRLVDTAGVIIEHSANWNTNNGSFLFWGGTSGSGTGAGFSSASRGDAVATGGQFSAASNVALTPPVSAVVTALHDIAASLSTSRANGFSGTATTAKGAGNFLAYPAYIYGRGGTTFPFNGLDFGHAVRFGPNLDAATIARVESLIARNTPEVTL